MEDRGWRDYAPEVPADDRLIGGAGRQPPRRSAHRPAARRADARPAAPEPAARTRFSTGAGTPAGPSRPSMLASLSWTAGAFLLPVLGYLGWTTTLSTTPRVGCGETAGCLDPRARAVANLIDALPTVAAALGAALLLAMGVRQLATTWRSHTVAFAASVIGAGVTTLLVSALG